MPHNLKLKINDKLEIWTGEESYRSLIMDLNKSEIMINIPVRGERYLVLDKGDIVEIYYSSVGKCYRLKCTVISRGIENNIGYYKLSMPSDVIRIQRRSNFRVDLINQVFYKKITDVNEENEDEDYEDTEYKKGIMLNLSAGGIRIEVEKPIEVNEVLKVRFMIRDEELVLRGIIVRCEDSLNGNKVCGIRFLDITERQCDKIIRELFEITRKQRTV